MSTIEYIAGKSGNLFD